MFCSERFGLYFVLLNFIILCSALYLSSMITRQSTQIPTSEQIFQQNNALYKLSFNAATHSNPFNTSTFQTSKVTRIFQNSHSWPFIHFAESPHAQPYFACPQLYETMSIPWVKPKRPRAQTSVVPYLCLETPANVIMWRYYSNYFCARLAMIVIIPAVDRLWLSSADWTN